MEKNAHYKLKGRKLESSKHESQFSSEESTKHNTKEHKDNSESSDSNQKMKKYKSYEEILGEFKKIEPHMFNGEIEKRYEAEAWLSRMNKISISITISMNQKKKQPSIT